MRTAAGLCSTPCRCQGDTLAALHACTAVLMRRLYAFEMQLSFPWRRLGGVFAYMCVCCDLLQAVERVLQDPDMSNTDAQERFQCLLRHAAAQ